MEELREATRVEAVYRSIHPKLWRALLAFTGDRELASDAESEAFAQVIRRADGVNDVAAWVWRSAFAIAAGMRAKAPPLRPPSDATMTGLDNAAPAAGSLAEFIAMLGGLSEQQRACVVLRYAAQLDTAAIAACLGTSEGTVRVQIHRAHATLRRTLKEVDGGR